MYPQRLVVGSACSFESSGLWAPLGFTIGGVVGVCGVSRLGSQIIVVATRCPGMETEQSIADLRAVLFIRSQGNQGKDEGKGSAPCGAKGEGKGEKSSDSSLVKGNERGEKRARS